jgi:hypothetical protein
MMTREPGGLIMWFVIGLTAGALVSVGALVGGLFFGPLFPGNTASWLGSALVLALGTLSLLIGRRLIAPRHRFGL